MIRLDDVVQVFRCPMHNLFGQQPFGLQASDGSGIGRQLVSRDRLTRIVANHLHGFAQEAMSRLGIPSVRRHHQVTGEGDLYPGYRSGSGGTRDASHLIPDLKGPSAATAMVSGVGVCRAAEEIGNLIMLPEEALRLRG